MSALAHTAKPNDGGPAFPSADMGNGIIGGMSIRDYFAGQALVGYCHSLKFRGATSDEQLAKYSFDLADEMLAERERRKK